MLEKLKTSPRLSWLWVIDLVNAEIRALKEQFPQTRIRWRGYKRDRSATKCSMHLDSLFIKLALYIYRKKITPN